MYMYDIYIYDIYMYDIYMIYICEQWYDFRFIVANNIEDYGWKYSDLNKIIRHFKY